MKSAPRRIYLDHAATAPLSDGAREALARWSGETGNASSLHAEGRRARGAIDEAREILASALGAEFSEVVFTSSGTEAAVLAIVGAALANEDLSRRRVILGAAEHPCVLETRPLLERLGYRIEHAPVDREARIRLDDLAAMLGQDVFLVSAMHANNELGTIQPIAEIANAVHSVGALLHTDAAQTFLALPWSIRELDADLVSLSGHKVGGPQGVGALWIRPGVRIAGLTPGGGQERGLRGGTESVGAIAAFGAAIADRIAYGIGRAAQARAAARNRFRDGLGAGFLPTVHRQSVLSGHAHVLCQAEDAETLLIRLDRDGVAASSGAACSAGSLEPSHVLLACGYSHDEARRGLRFTFWHETSEADAMEAARRVNEAVAAISIGTRQ